MISNVTRNTTLLTVTILSAVTTAPFRKLTASPLSRACLLAHSGNTHSRAPYHSGGSPKSGYVLAGSTPYNNERKYGVNELSSKNYVLTGQNDRLKPDVLNYVLQEHYGSLYKHHRAYTLPRGG